MIGVEGGGWRGNQANPDILYYGSGNQVFRRASAGVEAAPTAAPFPGGTVRDLALAPRDHDAVYAVDASRVFASPDGGATWRDLTGDLADSSLRSLVVIQVLPGVRTLVVGGLTGVWVTWQFGDQLPAQPIWFRLGTNLPTSPVWDLDWDGRDRVLTVATLGRGAWQARFD